MSEPRSRRASVHFTRFAILRYSVAALVISMMAYIVTTHEPEPDPPPPPPPVPEPLGIEEDGGILTLMQQLDEEFNPADKWSAPWAEQLLEKFGDPADYARCHHVYDTGDEYWGEWRNGSRAGLGAMYGRETVHRSEASC